MQIAIPQASEPVTYETGNATTSWFSFFEKLFKIVGGNYGLTLGGNLNVNTTSASNIDAGETDLISYVLPANTMINAGDYLEIEAWGVFAANGNNKTVKLKFGSQTILTTGAVAANDGSWSIKAKILRLSASSQEIISEVISSNSSVADSATRTAGTQTLSNSNTITCTGTATTSADITQYALVVKLTPNI
jgi:predicted RecA/RadA family phage recombinase